MSLLRQLNTVLSPLIPVETGVFSGVAPDRYVVITPIVETFELYADDLPRHEVQEVRLSLYDKGNYTAIKNTIVRALLAADITVTGRRYIGREDNTGYHHFAIDTAKDFSFDEEE